MTQRKNKRFLPNGKPIPAEQRERTYESSARDGLTDELRELDEEALVQEAEERLHRHVDE